MDDRKKAEAERASVESSFLYTVPLKFKNTDRTYSFGTDDDTLRKGDRVVVETAQGLEIGQCLDDAGPISFFHAHVPLKPVLRKADEEDLRRDEENVAYSKEAFHVCENEIHNLNLGMDLLSAEYMLDRSRILFIYKAEQRVDFRELLKRLGSRLHCRIELRQIGDRDKAKMVGGIGMCGMECCCARFKTHMDVISINMAKTQLLALNTEKLSGVCGKLMCCLKYENENYKALTEGLPKMGAHVEYEGNMYRVTSMNVMTDEARLENSETVQTVTLDTLRNETVVRKGVTVSRKGPGRTRPVTTAPGVHKNGMSSGPISTNFSTSAESRRHESGGAIPKARPQKRSSAHAGLRPQKKERPLGSRRRESAARNNANVTVRSFKSSRTRAKEAEGKGK